MEDFGITDCIFIGKNTGIMATTAKRCILIGHNLQLPTPDARDYCNIGGVEIELTRESGDKIRAALLKLIDETLESQEDKTCAQVLDVMDAIINNVNETKIEKTII